MCRAFADGKRWTVIREFTDAAIPGATLLRPGFQGLLEYALRGNADGLHGRVVAGESGGGLSYGYAAVVGATGDRAIVGSEALIVRRIFESFAGGASPKSIAKQLNADGIAGPSGKSWHPSTINGQPPDVEFVIEDARSTRGVASVVRAELLELEHRKTVLVS